MVDGGRNLKRNRVSTKKVEEEGVAEPAQQTGRKSLTLSLSQLKLAHSSLSSHTLSLSPGVSPPSPSFSLSLSRCRCLGADLHADVVIGPAEELRGDRHPPGAAPNHDHLAGNDV